MLRSDGPTCSTHSGGVEAEHLEVHRSELTAYCRRLLGCPTDAQDAVQETLIRAWRGQAQFEGRAKLRTWIYQIATNVCRNQMSRRHHRSESVVRLTAVDPPSNEADPADLTIAHDDLRRALDTPLGQLPPQQRAVLILREALRWPATDIAELLDVSVASVNSSLQRARANVAASRATRTDHSTRADEPSVVRASRLIDAFARQDYEGLARALCDDAKSA